MEKFEWYLRYGRRFKWRTDNIALKYWNTVRNLPPTIARWIDKLADYNFVVEHRAGVDHQNADTMSRYPAADTVTNEQTNAYTQAILGDHVPSLREADKQNFELGMIGHLGGAAHFRTLYAEDLAQLQDEDGDLAKIKSWIPHKTEVTTAEARSLSHGYQLYAKSLSRVFCDNQNVLRIELPSSRSYSAAKPAILPAHLVEKIVVASHVATGHAGWRYALHLLRDHAHFPNMRQEVERIVQACLECQQKRRKPPDQRAILASPITGAPFQRLHVDWVGPLNEGAFSKAKYLLTVRDAFTKWVEAIPSPDSKGRTAAFLLERDVFSRFGPPAFLHTDDAQCFKGKVFQDLADAYQIKLTSTGGYNPKSK